jgi:hypothetical protein
LIEVRSAPAQAARRRLMQLNCIIEEIILACAKAVRNIHALFQAEMPEKAHE